MMSNTTMEGLNKALNTYEGAIRSFDEFYVLPIDFGRTVTEAEAEEKLKEFFNDYEDYDEQTKKVLGMFRDVPGGTDGYYIDVLRAAADRFKADPDAASNKWVLFVSLDGDPNYSDLEGCEGAAWALIDLFPNATGKEYTAKWQLLPVFEDGGELTPDGFFSTLGNVPDEGNPRNDAEKQLRLAEAVFDISWEASFQFQKRCEKSYPGNGWDSRDLFAHVFDWAKRFEDSFDDEDDGADYLTAIAEFAQGELGKYFSGIFPAEEGGERKDR